MSNIVMFLVVLFIQHIAARMKSTFMYIVYCMYD